MTPATPKSPGTTAPIERLACVVLGREDPASIDGLGQRGLAPLVAAIRTDEIPPPARTRFEARRLAATRLVIEETARHALRTLHAAEQRPVLLKGLAMAEFYPRAELRPTGDVDLIVSHRELGDARATLEAAGWRSVVDSPWAEDYIQNEGYCWQAVRWGEAVLELHYRLWGSVAPEFAAAVVDAAVKTRETARLGETVRPCLEDLVVIAASHAWRQTTPRRGADFIDVALVLSDRSFDHGTLLQRTELSAQLLPVALCLRTLGHSLPTLARTWLVEELVPRLRTPERRLYENTHGTNPDQIRWSKIRLAMLLAGRPARLGWRAVWRRAWPHPVNFEQGPESPSLLTQRIRRLLHGSHRKG